MEKITEHDAWFEYTICANIIRLNGVFHDFCGKFSIKHDRDGYEIIVVEEKLYPEWQIENENPVSYYYMVWGRKLIYHTSRKDYLEKGITQDIMQKANIGVLVKVAIVEAEQNKCIFRATTYQDNQGAAIKFLEALEGYLFNVYEDINPTTSTTVGKNKTNEPHYEVQELDPSGGKYGTYRDLNIDDVRAIVSRCREFMNRGGQVPEFYRLQSIHPGGPRSYELATLRGWLKKPKFDQKKPKNSPSI